MKKVFVLIVISLVVLTTFGCDLFGSDDKDSSPVSPVERLLYRLADFAPDYFDEGFTATNSIWIRLRDGLDYRDVTAATISDPAGRDWSWDASQLAERWRESDQEFALLNLYASTTPHSLYSGAWNLVVTYQGAEFSVPFTVRSISDNIAGSRLYSDTSSDGPSQILGGAASITGVEIDASGTLSFGFNVTDSAVQRVYAWLYNANGDYLGNSPAITSGITDVTTFSRDVSGNPDAANVDKVRIVTLAGREDSATLHELWLNASALISVTNTYTVSGSMVSGSASPSSLMIVPDSDSDYAEAPTHKSGR